MIKCFICIIYKNLIISLLCSILLYGTTIIYLILLYDFRILFLFKQNHECPHTWVFEYK